MSSNISIQKICSFCKKEFTAKKTTTKYCSHLCNSRAYKANAKQQKINKTNTETVKTILFPIEQINAKDFLTVKEVSLLLNCSIKSIYRCINKGNLNSINIGERITRIKRTDIDKLFNNQTN